MPAIQAANLFRPGCVSCSNSRVFLEIRLSGGVRMLV
jgi:hypothetical protein